MPRQLKWLRCRGESLLEVIIAVTVLTIVLASAFGVLMQSSATNINSINRVVALNIAREGVEAVRNVRDTNWLKYSGNRREKWLCLDTLDRGPTDNESDDVIMHACKNNILEEITEAVYRVDFSNTVRRYLLENIIDTPSALTAKETLPIEVFRLYETAGRISHNTTGKTLPFYRQIQLIPEDTYLDPSAVNPCIVPGCPQDVRLHVLVRVQWMEGDNVRSLDLETYLYDFFGRDTY